MVLLYARLTNLVAIIKDVEIEREGNEINRKRVREERYETGRQMD